MRAYEAVGRVGAVGVYAVGQVGAHHALVGPRPDEAPGEERVARPLRPVLVERRSAALVVLAVQELRGHEHLVAVVQAGGTRLVGRVVVAVNAVPHGPGVYHVPPLRVKLGKERVEPQVVAALVAVAPAEHAGVVGVGGHHFLEYARAGGGAVVVLPARQLVEVEHSERVADVEEGVARRVVRAYGVGVHALYEAHVLDVEATVWRAPRLRVEAVAVHAAYVELHAVEVEAVAGAELNGAEAHAVGHFVGHGAVGCHEAQRQFVEVGVLRVPRLHAGEAQGHALAAL